MIDAKKWEDYLVHWKVHIETELSQGLYAISDGVRAYLRGQQELLGEMLSILKAKKP